MLGQRRSDSARQAALPDHSYLFPLLTVSLVLDVLDYIDKLGISHFGQWCVPNSLMAASNHYSVEGVWESHILDSDVYRITSGSWTMAASTQ